MAVFDELKRRKVFRVTSVYAVTAWGASLGAAELFPTFGLPDESVRWFVIAALSLLPVVALLAWLYELTPGGISRDPADLKQQDQNNAEISTQKIDSSTRAAPQNTADELTATWADGSKSFSRSFTIGRCLLYTSPSPRDKRQSRMPSSA